MNSEPLYAIETSQEVLPGDPAHVRNVTRDPAFSDEPLDRAATETQGKMDWSDWGRNSSGNLTAVGPVDHNAYGHNSFDHNSSGTSAVGEPDDSQDHNSSEFYSAFRPER